MYNQHISEMSLRHLNGRFEYFGGYFLEEGIFWGPGGLRQRVEQKQLGFGLFHE